jgi:Rieske Fe-S protein
MPRCDKGTYRVNGTHRPPRRHLGIDGTARARHDGDVSAEASGLQSTGPSRRAVTQGLGVAALATVLAGCDTYGAPASQPAPAPSSAASSGTTPPPSDGAAVGGKTLATTSDIAVGGGKILRAENIVITQATAGTFAAFSAVCTHQGCTVATVEGGTINCPCHGSKYRIADGAVAGGPAPRPLDKVAIVVDGDAIKQA